MKIYEMGSIIIVAAFVIVLAIGLISRPFLGNDNKVEEKVEELLKEKTGIDVDLSPGEEKKE